MNKINRTLHNNKETKGEIMDQLKLLNIHKMLSNFANNLIGAFVSLIIYQKTSSLSLAVLYLVMVNFLKLAFSYALRHLYCKYPQLFLLLRIVPITLYNLFILLLNKSIVIGTIGVCVFYAMSESFNSLPKELIFNYASLSKTENGDKSIGVTRLFEQAGIIIALVTGGYLLDVNQTLVLILALSIYTISVIPLVMYYIKCRKQKTFNKDATSNAISTIEKIETAKKETKSTTKRILLTYGIIYFSFAFLDILQTTFSLHVFIQKGEFALAGILNAIYNTFYAIGFYIAGIINEKKDTTILVSILSIIMGISVIILPFVSVDTLFPIICMIYGIIGISLPFLSLFVLDRMLIKTRIMGCSNDALITRELGCYTSYIVGYAFGFIGLVAIFIVIGISMFASSAIIPIGEESTRKDLVDFLQNNEVTHRTKRKNKVKTDN